LKILEVKVIPNSKKELVSATGPNAFKVKVAALAIEGAANEAVIRMLAEFLNTKPKQLRILSGHKNPHKRIEWDDGEG
jgi:uncharacterized protein (TIGR00251 family)